MDRLETADRGAVKAEAVGEDRLVERFDGHGEVLHDPGQIAEPHVDGLDLVIPDEPQDLVGVGEHASPPRTAGPTHGKTRSARCGNPIDTVLTSTIAREGYRGRRGSDARVLARR